MEEKNKRKESKIDEGGKKAEKLFETGSDAYNKAGEIMGKAAMYLGKAAIKVTTGAVKLGAKIGEEGLEKVLKEGVQNAEDKVKDIGNKVKDSFKDEAAAKETLNDITGKVVNGIGKAVRYTTEKIGEFSGTAYAKDDDKLIKNKEYSIGDRFNGMLKKEQVEDCKKYVTNLKSKLTKGKVSTDVAQYIADEAYKNASTTNENLADSLKKWRMDGKNEDPTMTIKAIKVMEQYIRK